MPSSDLFAPMNLDGFADEEDTREASRVLSLLSSYANNRAQAMKMRAAGDIQAAQSWERAADATYQRLPQWARW